MSATPTTRILLVAKLGEVEEIASALVGAGFPAPAVATGGDDTLALCAEVAAEVVVLSASLEEGDARALAMAMRGTPRGSRLRIVLVGEARGPIRNALDAADFEVDRFVGRPLSSKALAFAVRSCASELAEEQGGRPRRDRAPTARPSLGRLAEGATPASPGALDESGPMVGRRAVTAPMVTGDRSGAHRQRGMTTGQDAAPEIGSSGNGRTGEVSAPPGPESLATTGGSSPSPGAAGSGLLATTDGRQSPDPAAPSDRGLAGDDVPSEDVASPDPASETPAPGVGPRSSYRRARTSTTQPPASGRLISGSETLPHGTTAPRPPAGSAGRVAGSAPASTTKPMHGAGPAWPTPRPLPPPPRPSERFPIMRMATTPGTGPGLPPGPVVPGGRRPPGGGPSGLDRAMDEAISRFVSDAMSALEPGWSVEPDGRVRDAVADLTARTVSTSGGSSAQVDADGDPSEEGGEAGEAESSWREPPPAPAWREPTLILPGGGQGAPAPMPAPARVEADVDVTAPQPSSPWDDVGDSAGSLDSADSIDASAPDPRPRRRRADSIDGELERAALGDDGRDPRLPPGLLGGLDTGEAGRAGDDDRPRSALARELRRKMSMMAERLFPGRGERSRLDVGLAHDAHTEIDLAAIGGEPPVAAERSAPYETVHSVDTFADTNPLSNLEPTPPVELEGDEREETTGRRRSSSREPPTRGDLADIDVASLMGRLLQSRFTGRLQLRRGPAEKAIQFEDGRPVFAQSNLPHDRMGDLLYREGKITREQQQRARDLVVEYGRRMGEILVEFGFLKPRELLPAVRHHIEDIVYSVFAWDSGEFAVAAGESTTERIRLTRHPAAVVLEGVRRKYGPDLLEARLGSAGAVVSVRSQRQIGAIAAVADLSASERAVIQKLDGERTIQQVAEAAQVDHLAALQLAFGLVALGAAEVVAHGPSGAERPPARARSLVGETDIAIDRQRVLAKHALVHEADYFTLLGVRRDATSFEIRRAYEAARRDYAPAVFPSELQRELAGELGEINRLIDEAYQVLRDEQVRRSYQANLLD